MFNGEKFKNMAFKDRLKYLREKRGFASYEFADKIGVSPSTYSGYEKGRRVPSVEIISDIAALLHTSADFLLCLIDDPAPKKPERNIKEYFKEGGLHFDGVPISDEELKPLQQTLANIAKLKKL